jgi:tetratricopeptide (TPR) repeat protein
MARWHVGCNACDAGGWIGARESVFDAWCEGCQSSSVVAPDARRGLCSRCGGVLTTTEPRFEELLGEIQHVDAVLAAWAGDPSRLAAILPERPRYLTDLTPPSSQDGDPAPVREALARLLAGAYADARRRLESMVADRTHAGDACLWQALGIAAQRTGELALAESAFGRALEHEPALAAAWLDRGALRARRGDYAGARADFARAGEGREARWNRAALAVLEAVAVTPGLPDASILDAARESAGEPSAYWSEHTIGRLLWTALVERARTRGEGDAAACVDERVLRAAEAELEFRTFWDQALVVHGYASLGMKEEAATAASPLALGLLDALLREPALAGPAGNELRSPLTEVGNAARDGDPRRAIAALATLLSRDDLRHYRVPCRACGRGTIGVDAVEDRPDSGEEVDEPAVDPATGDLVG